MALVLVLSKGKLIFIIIKTSIKPNTFFFILFPKAVVIGIKISVIITGGIVITVPVNIINKWLVLVNNIYITGKIIRYVII